MKNKSNFIENEKTFIESMPKGRGLGFVWKDLNLDVNYAFVFENEELYLKHVTDFLYHPLKV
jgi:hypothetical protein